MAKYRVIAKYQGTCGNPMKADTKSHGYTWISVYPSKRAAKLAIKTMKLNSNLIEVTMEEL